MAVLPEPSSFSVNKGEVLIVPILSFLAKARPAKVRLPVQSQSSLVECLTLNQMKRHQVLTKNAPRRQDWLGHLIAPIVLVNPHKCRYCTVEIADGKEFFG
jgi:hypothetical protein